MKHSKIYQLKVNLLKITPPIWRRLLVPDNCSLDDLHIIIQCAMGWSNHYLHSFESKGQCYKSGSLFGNGRHYDALNTTNVKLSDLKLKVKDSFLYIYEFIDYWEHRIILEEITTPDMLIKYPLCLDGRRACPPEDCGGPLGYKKILVAFKNKRDSKHHDINEWLPKDFDPEHFDKDDVNLTLARFYERDMTA
jgi:hypothetical protein